MSRYEKSVKKTIEECQDPRIRVSPLKAIRAKCLDCMCFVASEVTRCPSKDCPLYKFRFGANESGKRGVGGNKIMRNSVRERFGIAVKKS